MAYRVTPTDIEGALILEPQVFGDARGFFLESFNQADFEHALGMSVQFVQDNHSRSAKGVLRGLHYQIQQHVVAPLACAQLRGPRPVMRPARRLCLLQLLRLQGLAIVQRTL